MRAIPDLILVACGYSTHIVRGTIGGARWCVNSERDELSAGRYCKRRLRRATVWPQSVRRLPGAIELMRGSERKQTDFDGSMSWLITGTNRCRFRLFRLLSA